MQEGQKEVTSLSSTLTMVGLENGQIRANAHVPIVLCG
jgi:hypothetical protein